MKIRCHECGVNCGTNHDQKLVYRAYVLCHECLGKVPAAAWEAFTKALHGDGSKRYIETPDDEFGPLPQDLKLDTESVPHVKAKKSRKQPTKLEDLTVHDRLEVKHFHKYLALVKTYGEGELRQRPFWRKYLGLPRTVERTEAE